MEPSGEWLAAAIAAASEEPGATSAKQGPKAPRKNDFSKYWGMANVFPASLFVPNGPIDVLRDTWRRVVFRVDYRSATAIADVMMEDVPESELYRLLDNWLTAHKEFEELKARTHWDDTEFLQGEFSGVRRAVACRGEVPSCPCRSALPAWYGRHRYLLQGVLSEDISGRCSGYRKECQSNQDPRSLVSANT